MIKYHKNKIQVAYKEIVSKLENNIARWGKTYPKAPRKDLLGLPTPRPITLGPKKSLKKLKRPRRSLGRMGSRLGGKGESKQASERGKRGEEERGEL